MNIDDKYWCIEPSTETLSYNCSHPPVRPWLGVVTKIYPTCSVINLNRFSKETGEPDYDTNATATVVAQRLFASEREAFEQYAGEIKDYFANARAQLHDDEYTELEYINKKRMEFLNVG